MVAYTHSDLRKIGSRQASCLPLIDWFVFRAACQSQERTCKKPTSDSCERHKIASAWQQRLHRAIIDTSVVNRVARKF
ncbi:MAG: hypothetical protein DME71_11705 [Verrucomicrobia bacterium]|nr:MAG: hypothetical protein DME92_07270 [Verrucomicrobiota bacterium]PYJ88841.1 MAG: hypothetical protein DME71_11705 [Verrucomicrobiota bacterium]